MVHIIWVIKCKVFWEYKIKYQYYSLDFLKNLKNSS